MYKVASFPGSAGRAWERSYVHGTIHYCLLSWPWPQHTAGWSDHPDSWRHTESWDQADPTQVSEWEKDGRWKDLRKSQWQYWFWPLTRVIKCVLCSHRETFDRQKMDIRSLTQEHQANKRALDPKVLLVGRDSSLASNDSDIRLAIWYYPSPSFFPSFPRPLSSFLLSTLSFLTHFSAPLYPWSLVPFISLLSPGTFPRQPGGGHPVHAECIGCSSGRARYWAAFPTRLQWPERGVCTTPDFNHWYRIFIIRLTC